MKSGKNQIMVRQQYSGPVPPASELIRYNEASPDAADRILTMAENQARHRQECEKAVIKNEYKIAMASLIIAFLIALVLCGIIAYSMYLEQFGVAIVSAIGAIGTVAGIFIVKKIKENQETAPGK